MAIKIKVDGKWYRGSEKADGSIEFKDDLNYNGSNTQVEYTAKKPNPVLHPGLYHFYNMNGSKEGEFWTDPQISYSGCITDIETDIKNSSGNSSTTSYSPGYPSGGSGSGGGGLSFWAILGLLLLALWHFLKGPFEAFVLLKAPAARKEWWGTVARSFFLSLLVGFILGSMVQAGSAGDIIASIFVAIFGLTPIVIVCIRRMHHIGKSGWWSLIPFVGFVMCGFFPGKIEDNKYI
jgi:uncharacterized membrane protein YhaH (DUF805 family)